MAAEASAREKFTRAVDPEAILERLVGKSHSIVSLLKKIGRKIFAVGAILIVLFILLATIVIPYRCAKTGTCDAFLKSIGFLVEETQVGTVAQKGFFAAWDILWNPQKYTVPGAAFSFDEKQTDVINYGVKINSFRLDGFVEVNEPISAVAQVNIKAPEDYDLLVDFTDACSMEGYAGKTNVVGPFDSGNSIRVFSGQERDVGISCEFPDGIKSIEKEIETRKMYIRPKYELTQQVVWKIVAKFENYRTDRRVVSKAELKGPMTISLFSLDSQPFYKGLMYRLNVGLSNNKEVWGGNLDKIKDIEVKLPSNVKLITSDQFCDFEEAGSEEGFANYAIKQTELEKANYDCGFTELLVREKLTREECFAQFKDDVQYSCKFTFTSAESIASLQEFKASIVYAYTGEKALLVTINKA